MPSFNKKLTYISAFLFVHVLVTEKMKLMIQHNISFYYLTSKQLSDDDIEKSVDK